MPDGERPNAEERRRAKRLAHALELAGLAHTLCVELDEILVEWLAREFADVRATATQRATRSPVCQRDVRQSSADISVVMGGEWSTERAEALSRTRS